MILSVIQIFIFLVVLNVKLGLIFYWGPYCFFTILNLATFVDLSHHWLLSCLKTSFSLDLFLAFKETFVGLLLLDICQREIFRLVFNGKFFAALNIQFISRVVTLLEAANIQLRNRLRLSRLLVQPTTWNAYLPIVGLPALFVAWLAVFLAAWFALLFVYRRHV